MKQISRKTVLIGVMLAMMALAAAWNVSWMNEQALSAERAAQDMARCERVADEIESLRKQPTVAASTEIGANELGQRIEAASQRAQLHGGALEGIYPQAARRVGDSSYLEQPTSLAMRGVMLNQLAMFLHHLTADSGMTVRDLRLRSPNDGTVGVWDAEATLTYLIYSPPDRSRHQH